MKSMVATFCVAICAAFVLVTSAGLVNQVEHALLADHDHPEQVVTIDDHHEHDDHDGHDDGGVVVDADNDDGQQPGHHHHHSDAPTSFLLASADAGLVLPVRTIGLQGQSDVPPPRLIRTGPERPPKPLTISA